MRALACADHLSNLLQGRLPDSYSPQPPSKHSRHACAHCISVEAYRVNQCVLQFGTVTWQLNEIWPTGGWGSIEYGTVGFTGGQVSF